MKSFYGWRMVVAGSGIQFLQSALLHQAFGPVATVLPYRDTADAIALARRGEGSLAASVFCADDSLAKQIVLGLAPYHGRILVVNRACAKDGSAI